MTDVPNHTQRRRLRPITILVVSVLVLAIAAGFLWLRHTRSPSYSLASLAQATEARDWGSAQQYMDVERVASAFVSSALASSEDGDDGQPAEKPIGGREGVPKEEHMGGVKGSRGASGAMAETFGRRFADSLRAAVEAGTLDADAGGLPRIMHGVTPRRVSYSGSGDASAVLVEVPTSSGETQQVTIRMEKSDDHWRIVALEGIDDLLGAIE